MTSAPDTPTYYALVNFLPPVYSDLAPYACSASASASGGCFYRLVVMGVERPDNISDQELVGNIDWL